MTFINIARTDISLTTSVFLGVQQIYGIGKFSAQVICKNLGLNPNLSLSELSSNEFKILDVFILRTFITGLDLRRKRYIEIKYHLDLKTYKGLKHKNKSDV